MKSELISKILVTTLATVALASAAHAAVVVSPANMDGWAFTRPRHP